MHRWERMRRNAANRFDYDRSTRRQLRLAPDLSVLEVCALAIKLISQITIGLRTFRANSGEQCQVIMLRPRLLVIFPELQFTAKRVRAFPPIEFAPERFQSISLGEPIHAPRSPKDLLRRFFNRCARDGLWRLSRASVRLAWARALLEAMVALVHVPPRCFAQ